MYVDYVKLRHIWQLNTDSGDRDGRNVHTMYHMEVYLHSSLSKHSDLNVLVNDEQTAPSDATVTDSSLCEVSPIDKF